MSTKTIRLLLLLALSAIWEAGNLFAQAPSRTTPLAECQIGKGARLIEVPVKVQNINLTFILDTGAAYTCFDRRHRDLLGKAIRLIDVATPDGKIRVLQYHCPPARWMGLEVPEDVEVITSDLASIRMATGRSIDGIIGMDVLHHYAIEIDFDSGLLRIWDARPGFSNESDFTLKMSLNQDYLPLIPVHGAHGSRAECLIDTGSDLSTLTPVDGQRWYDQGDFQYFRRGNLAATVTGLGSNRNGRTPELKLAGHSLKDMRFNISELNLIGLNALSRFKILLDFPKSELTVMAGSHFHDLDQPATSGLAALWFENRLIVVNVQPGSPAGTAGIQKGDIICRINSTEVSELDYRDVAELLTSNPGRRLQLILERNKTTVCRQIVLAPRTISE